MKIIKIIVVIIFMLCILFSCDHGVSPEKVKETDTKDSGISGTIYYQNWPPQDSLIDLRVVVFKNYPPADIVGEVTSGEAIAYPDIALPFFVDSTNYEILLDSGIYEYLVIAQQYGPAIFFDWQVAGHYDTTLNDTLPSSVEVFSDSIINGIDIVVDFDSLPGQPF